MDPQSALAGHRRFVWFEPAKRRPTDYESYTVGQQSFPEQWLDVDWPLRSDDGRAPFVTNSTALRCTHWGDWRDPHQVWQRPFVQRMNHEEQALDAFTEGSLDANLVSGIRPAWLSEVLSKYYAAWPFVEYGQFLALCFGVREALADTLIFATAFQCADKMKHLQDIVHVLLRLSELSSDFSDAGARSAWLEDPILGPLRETIEHINASADWGEILVVVNLVLEPLAGDLAKSEFFARCAPQNGDPITPVILSTVQRDSKRHRDTTKELVQFAVSDSEHGDANRTIIKGWVARWTPHCERAALALRGLFELGGIASVPFDPAWKRVCANHRSMLAELGLWGGAA